MAESANIDADEYEVSSKVATLENVLRKMPIWTCLEELLTECKDLKQQMNDFATTSMKTKLQIDALPMFNSFSHLEINDEIEVKHNRPRIPLPAQASYLQDKKTKKLIRVPIEEDICATPEKIHAKKLEESHLQKNISILNLEKRLEHDEPVYVFVKANKAWLLAKITLIYANKGQLNIRVKTIEEEHPRTLNVNKYRVARIQEHENHLRPVKRVIAGVSRTTMMSGIIAESPTLSNNKRYLVFYDNGSARYHKPNEVYPILGQTKTPWNDILSHRNSKVAAHLRSFFARWPHRRFILMEPGQSVHVCYDGQVVEAKCIEIDCSVVRLLYSDKREETIYRGSPRLITSENRISQLLGDEIDISRFDDRLRNFINLYFEASYSALGEDPVIISRFIEDSNGHGICRRNVATKSTTLNNKKNRSSPTIKVEMGGAQVEDYENLEEYTGDEVETHKKCTPACLEDSKECPDLEQKYRNESVLKIPSLIGWRRTLRHVTTNKNKTKTKLQVVYESPCGRLFKLPMQIIRYIRDTGSQLDIDYFTFDTDVRFNPRHLETTAIAKYYEADLSMVKINNKYQALEKKPVSIINTVSNERLPEDFEYRSTRFFHPNLVKKGFTFNEEFRSCCDCEDDCSTRASCACQNLTEDFYQPRGLGRGQFIDKIQYRYKRLLENVKTGIFECNADCKCSSKCPNRVVQNGLRFRLQVFKTIDKGWGVRTLDDIPKGAFVSTYSAEVLDDADQYGDSDVYYADLDYITVNEGCKSGYESEAEEPDDDEKSKNEDSDSSSRNKEKSKVRKNIIDPSDSDSDISELHENDMDSQESFRPSQEQSASEGEDDQYFDPDEGFSIDHDYLPQDKPVQNKKRSLPLKLKSRYPKRHRSTPQHNPNSTNNTTKNPVKFKRIHTILGTENNYTLDARMQGNVGRFYNHCCDPNLYVQNVFIDTHDLRFPVVAFFASTKIHAMEEITWNYQYQLGSIPGRELKCYCGTMNCKGRIL